jgi:preprotein translocase subunit SecG
MFTFLLVVQFIIAALLVGVILVQKSEGGGLTTGGSPAGLMSARGAADFLTRLTAILATAFILMSIVLAFLAATRHSTKIDAGLQKVAPAAVAPLTVPAAPAPTGNDTAPTGNSAVPFSQ